MENSDKGRSKWDNNSEMRFRDDMKNGRRGKPQAAIYRPGSGPLRKSEEFSSVDNVRRTKSPVDNFTVKGVKEEFDQVDITKLGHSIPKLDHQAIPNKSNFDSHDSRIEMVTDSMENVYIGSSVPHRSTKHRRNSLGNISAPTNSRNQPVNDVKKKGKKPEQARYVPKLVAQAIAERDIPRQVDMKSHKYHSSQQQSRDENWDEVSVVHGAKNAKSQKPENWGQNTGSVSHRHELLGRSKYEGNRRGGRGHVERNWPNKDVGNGHGINSGSSTKVLNEEGNPPVSKPLPDLMSMQLGSIPRNSDVVHGAMSGSNQVAGLPRELRQASEPRILPPTSLNLELNRTRDTRSVEPAGSSGRSWQGEKLQAKPPSGRRGSGKDSTIPNTIKPNVKPHPNFDSLPPRLRKKYLLENGLTEPLTHVGNSSVDDVWDGSSVTFQGASGSERGGGYLHQQQHQQQRHILSHQLQQHPQHFHQHHPPPGHPQSFHPMQHHPQHMNHHQFQQMQPPQHWASTLPTRARGRGRLRPEDLEMERIAASTRFSRSLTPDRLSMPPPSLPDTRSPPPGYAAQQFRRVPSQENVPRENRMYTPPPSPPPQRLMTPTRGYRQDERRGSTQLQDEKVSPLLARQEDRSNRRRVSESNSWGSRENLYSNRRQDANSNHAKSSDSQQSSTDTLRNSPSPKILDWGDEVEETERLEAERKLNANADRNQSHSAREKKKRRRKRGSDLSGPDDRSLSRGRDHSHDRNFRGNSRERLQRTQSKDRHNRGNSQERHQRGKLHDERSKETTRVEKRYNDKDRNWRDGEKCHITDKSLDKPTNQIAGIIVLPSQVPTDSASPTSVTTPHFQTQTDAVSYPTYRAANQQSSMKQQQQRQLFNPNNPTKPIMVSATGPRAVVTASQNDPVPTVPIPSFTPSHPSGFPYSFPTSTCSEGPSYITDQFGNSRPSWYDPYSTSFRAAHNPHLLLDIERADLELHWFLSSDGIFRDWSRIAYIRHFLQQCLQTLLITDIKFCQTENVEQHLWKILFYNIIELLRKIMSEDSINRDRCKQTILTLIDEGTTFLESILSTLEHTYKFKLDTFLSPNHIPTKGLGFAGLALVSAQKIYLFLGDLARYKEQVCETTNFGKARQYYIKAHQINPKNGRPYNQLAILAVYARRKLDAVYYYMRSLMASNPFLSAKDSLVTLFDENRKKYEQSERKRREERESRDQDRMKEKEGAGMEAGGNGLRREYWVRPEGGRKRLHITSSASLEQQRVDSEEEELHGLSSIEVNKRFITSYLNVHGKLFSKVGMETFQEAALQMLREFRALLQHSPVPLNANRVLQLLALNMFAIDNTQLKDSQLEPGYRSAVQENALIVSIQMFNLLLERCVSLLREQFQSSADVQPSRLIVNEDMLVLLPAVKVWCDWLLCHGGVWNPPPSCLDYRVGPAGDAWCRLATLVNLLNKLNHKMPELIHETGREGFELVRLPEDAMLCGFTPLMYNTQEPSYTPAATDMEVAQVAVRLRKIIFFGTVFLCGVDPPVIKLQKFEGVNEYVSVVQSSSQSSPSSPPEEHISDSELHIESFSEDDEEDAAVVAWVEGETGGTPEEITALLHRKEVLERRHEKQERHRLRVQAILRASVVSVEIEVKPHYLVPDTNCFIDYLSQLQKIAHAGTPLPLYTLMVPLIVFKELEGLSRGGKGRVSPTLQRDVEHVAKVAECSKNALTFLRTRHPCVRCVTTKGTILATTTFTMEEDTETEERNDDRILTTALNLSNTSGKDLHKTGEPRRLYREVVLLTEDRNLRVKALSRDIPVREVPVFMKWADLG